MLLKKPSKIPSEKPSAKPNNKPSSKYDLQTVYDSQQAAIKEATSKKPSSEHIKILKKKKTIRMPFKGPYSKPSKEPSVELFNFPKEYHQYAITGPLFQANQETIKQELSGEQEKVDIREALF